MERMMQLLYGSATATESDQASSSSASAAAAADRDTETTGDPGSRRAAPARQGPGLGLAGTCGRDLESHRLIEKRRRDRMNSALSELSCLIPAARAKQGVGRIEKAEIIEMAIQHIIALSTRVAECRSDAVGHQIPAICAENFQQGFLDCTRVTLSFLAETEGAQSSTDGLCAHLYANLHCAMQRLATVAKDESQALPTKPVESSSNEQQIDRMPQLYKLDDRLPAANDTGDSKNRQVFQLSEPALALATATANNSKNKPPALQKLQHQQQQQQRIWDNSGVTAGRGEASTCSRSRSSSRSSSRSRSGSRDSSSTGSSAEGADRSGDHPHLPGFVLHPSGTHYLPLVLPRLALSNDDDGGDEAASEEGQRSARSARRSSTCYKRAEVLHPISIPVSFRSARLVQIASSCSTSWDAKASSGLTGAKRKRSATDCLAQSDLK